MTDTSTATPADGYLEWAQESLGVVVHHPLTISPAPGMAERGVYCEEDIPAEAIVVSVPWEALMTIDSAKGTPFEGLSEAGAREDDVLCLLLLYHRHILKEKSQLERHIDALPREYHQTIFYSDEELKLLRGTSLHALTTVWKSQVANDLRELQELELPSEGSSTAQSALEGFLTKEGYQWALATVWSRFVTVERQGRKLKAMAPVFDMFNHDPSASTVHGFQETNQCLHLVTLQAWEKGSEVRFNYGPLSNSRLLLLHGFCVPDNAFDAVELWLKMEEGAPDYAAKCKIIEENGVDPSKRPFNLTRSGFDAALLAVLRVQRATESELKIAAESPWGEPLSARNEAEVCDVLCAALARMLKDREAPSLEHVSCNGPSRGIPATAAADQDGGGELQEQEAVARMVSSEDRKRAAELVRSGEERVVRLCLELVEAHRTQQDQQRR